MSSADPKALAALLAAAFGLTVLAASGAAAAEYDSTATVTPDRCIIIATPA